MSGPGRPSGGRPAEPGRRPATPGRPWPTGTTRLIGVIGDPVRHSLSPVLHNAAFAALGLDRAYVALPVIAARVGAAVQAVLALGFEGLNVTMPHKAAVLAHLDRVSPTAALLGAVNTVVRVGDELVGESTDGSGFLDALRLEERFDPAGRSCLVVGAGGAGRAVVLALARAGAASVVVVNRNAGRAEAAVALAGRAGRVGVAEQADGADLIVNATPLGLAGTPGGGRPRRRAVGTPQEPVPRMAWQSPRTGWGLASCWATWSITRNARRW
ncbi:MAG: shikimate dehydrogenase family protein [Acidimicrobiales bacterium]